MFGKLALLLTLLCLAKGQDENYDDEEVPSTLIPHLLSEPIVVEATVGERVTFPCEVDDLGVFVMLWMKGKSQVLFASELRVMGPKRFDVSGNSLIISSVQPDDNGEYICQISTNPPQSVTHVLNVLYPPKVVPEPKDGFVTVKEGESVTLSCSATGNPPPSISWKRAGRNYDVTDKFTISNALKSAAGEYECIADNGVGSPASAVITVEVVSPPKVFPNPRDGLLVVKEGEPIEISCEAVGDPVPVISWKTPGTEKPQKSRDTSRIVISEAERSHAGVYECIANNSLGVFSSAQIRVQVLYPPEIKVQNSWIHAGEGSMVNMSCTVRGEPTPTVVWKKGDGKDIHSNDHYHLKTSGHHHMLQIRHLRDSDYGRYECVASNSLRHVTESVHIIGTPQVPMFTSLPHGTHSRQYTLSWTVKSFSPIDEYSLIYRKKAENEDWTSIPIVVGKEVSGVQSHSYELSDLQPGTSYEAMVTARNKFGWSKQSDAFIFTTKNEAESVQETMSSVSTDDSETVSSNEQRLKANSSNSLRPAISALLVQCLFAIAYLFH